MRTGSFTAAVCELGYVRPLSRGTCQERHHSFGIDLIGQSYALDLHPDQASGAVPR